MNCKNYKCYRKNLENYNSKDLNQFLDAIQIAIKKYQFKYDKYGNELIFHTLTVSKCVNSLDAKIVAILHDVIENSSIEISFLEKQGFSKNIISAIRLLLKDKTITYEQYILNISKNTLASEVKLADICYILYMIKIQKKPTTEFLKKYEIYIKSLIFLLQSQSK